MKTIWFRDSSGQKISLSDKIVPLATDIYRFDINSIKHFIFGIIKNSIFRYYGTGIRLGDCGITIMNASHNDSGTWSCHMGVTHTAKTDSMKEISVRITGEIDKNKKKFFFSYFR